MKIEKLDPKKLTDTDWKELHEFTTELFAELFPNETDVNLEYVKQTLTDTHDGFVSDHYIIKEGDKITAKARFAYTKPSPITKETDTDNVNIDIWVRREYRRKKLASELLSYVLKNELLERHVKVNLSASRSPGYEFCESFEGKITGENYTSNLYFDKANWEKIRKINNDITDKSKEFSIQITEGISPENETQYLDIFCDLLEELSEKYDDYVFNRELSMKNLKESIHKEKSRGAKTYIAWARNKTGKLVGISELFSSPARKEKLVTVMSGVVKEHRKKVFVCG